MIKANELRIGNLVLRNNKFDGLPRVTKIIGMMIFQAEKEPDEFDTIPLTAEWLERFGVGNTLAWFKLYQNTIRDGSGRYDGYVILSEIPPKKSLRIDYVHHLQNLFFALTGNELEVKP